MEGGAASKPISQIEVSGCLHSQKSEKKLQEFYNCMGLRTTHPTQCNIPDLFGSQSQHFAAVSLVGISFSLLSNSIYLHKTLHPLNSHAATSVTEP